MKKFFKTVFIVTVFSICEKALGFLYRIYLSRSIGSEGLGLYQVSLSLFALLLTACSGTPITVSRLITKYKAENRQDKVLSVISAGLSSTLFFTVPICLTLFLLKNKIGVIFSDERCIKIFYTILPALIFNSLYSVMRGVFWGNKDFLSYSIIELLEEICMIVFGIFLISRKKDIFDGAVKATVAVFISYLFSFSLSFILFFKRKNTLVNPVREYKPLFASAMPITAMRTASSVASSLLSIILPMQLVKSGLSSSGAMSLYGSAMGQAMPILFIPTTLIGSFTLVLVPEISDNFYRNNFIPLEKDVEKSLKYTLLLSAVFVPVFTVCGNEIGVLIFNSAECGKFLSFSSFIMIFMGLSNISTSILNSIGKEKQTLIFYIVSTVFMLLSIYFLPKFIGIYSLTVGFTCVYGITTVANMFMLSRYCKITPKQNVVKVLLLTAVTIFLGVLLEKMIINALGLFLSLIIVSAVLFTFICCLFWGLGLIDIDLFRIRRKKTATA